MSGPQFFQTVMGQRFYEGTMPKLARAAEAIAVGLKGHNEQAKGIVEALARQNELLAVNNRVMVEVLKALEALGAK